MVYLWHEILINQPCPYPLYDGRDPKRKKKHKIIKICILKKVHHTSEKSVLICPDIPWRDIRYSRIRHWSRVWNLPSRIWKRYALKVETQLKMFVDQKIKLVYWSNIYGDLLISRQPSSSRVQFLLVSLMLTSTMCPVFYQPHFPKVFHKKVQLFSSK